jgi:hypothetical protein
MKLLGIDPGFSGAIAHLDPEDDFHWLSIFDPPVFKIKKAGSKNLKSVYDMPALVNLLELNISNGAAAAIEIQTSRPMFIRGAGGESMPGGQSSSAMGAQMQGYGMYLGMLAALRVPLFPVTPAEWKGAFKLTSDKSLSRIRASELMPECSDFWAPKKGRADRAEAALLALWMAKKAGVVIGRVRPRLSSDARKAA